MRKVQIQSATVLAARADGVNDWNLIAVTTIQAHDVVIVPFERWARNPAPHLRLRPSIRAFRGV
jgi:hypothetical protein